MRRTVHTGSEQLIGALIPVPWPRPVPAPAPLPVLPAQRLPTDLHVLPLLEVARLDRSGRLSARRVLNRLGWRPGHRVDVDVARGVVLVAAAVDGAHVVGSRGDLALPAAARTLCGIAVADAVVVAAYPPHGVVVVHPIGTLARLVHKLHMSFAAGDAA